jgi:hypothetical protein|tara:strand:+ start:1774 stop:1995 length:222 start_codon:yes stop_codon:yes gene_type:complete
MALKVPLGLLFSTMEVTIAFWQNNGARALFFWKISVKRFKLGDIPEIRRCLPVRLPTPHSGPKTYLKNEGLTL